MSVDTEVPRTEEPTAGATGKVIQIIGPVIDVEFPPDQLPEIYNAVAVESDGKTLIAEVQQHLGNNWVRCVAMGSTDGLQRGMPAVDTGGPITVPVGDVTLGRIFNLLGEPIDQAGEIKVEQRWPIHRPAPSVTDLTPTQEILEVVAGADALS